MSAPSVGAQRSSRPSLAVVVLNWNGAEDTLACLASLRESREPVHAIVVDNGSTGNDAERIRASGLADDVLETGRNLGYAAGNNVGLQHALDGIPRFEFVAVLNNDTIVDRDCFGGLVEYLREHDRTPLALAPTSLYFDNPAKPWFAGGIVDEGWPRHLQPAELPFAENPSRPSEWLSGCCIVTRDATWRTVGLFRPEYFLIFEDCEWSLRARRAGVELAVLTRSTILHRVSRSFSSGPSSRLGSFYFIRNGLCFELAYARRYLALFLYRHLLRPTVSDVVRLRLRPALEFRWLGALAFLARQSGAAPAFCARLAEWQNRRAERKALNKSPSAKTR